MFQYFSISRGLRNCRLNYVHLRSYLFLPFVARERKRNKIKNQFTLPSPRNIMFTAVLSRYHYQGPWYSIVWTSYVLSVFHRCAPCCCTVYVPHPGNDRLEIIRWTKLWTDLRYTLTEPVVSLVRDHNLHSSLSCCSPRLRIAINRTWCILRKHTERVEQVMVVTGKGESRGKEAIAREWERAKGE